MKHSCAFQAAAPYLPTDRVAEHQDAVRKVCLVVALSGAEHGLQPSEGSGFTSNIMERFVLRLTYVNQRTTT
jgi:hypothetical protein